MTTVTVDRPDTAPQPPLLAAVPDDYAGRERGALALDTARAFYRRHFHFPSTVQADLFTVWTAGLTHMRDHNHRYVGSTAVRLYVRASTSNAGKSLLARFIELTGGRGEIVFSPASTYWGVVQMIAQENKTVVLDNFDEARGNAKQGQLNIALAGAYDDTALLRSGKKDDPEAYVFGPIAITAIGDALRRSSSFKPVEERSAIVDVSRAPKDAKIERFDRRDPEHKFRAESIRRACEEWGRNVAPDFATYRPTDLPVDDMDSRALDMWEPLVAVADLAGGQWPARIRRALRALVLSEAVEADEDDDPFARLSAPERSMVDVAHVFRAAGADATPPAVASLTTVDLLTAMSALPGGKRWAVPPARDPDRQRLLKARTMALASDLSALGVVRSSVKVPAGDDPSRYVNGWFWADIRDRVPSDLPSYRPSDLAAADDEEVPFD